MRRPPELGRVEEPIGSARLAIADILETDPTAWMCDGLEIGRSRHGRAIRGFETGSGPALVTLIGGCHADEPVGPALLDRLASHLGSLAADHPHLRLFTWRIVAHVNPDGEERNRSWTRQTVPVRDHLGRPDHAYDLATYLRSVEREKPGDDIEFGFPCGEASRDGEVRPENRAVADFLAIAGGLPPRPLRLHGSLHGMGLAPGPWYLLERSWIERTAALRARLAAATAAMDYRLFDAERHGEKGFHRVAPGFTTRPDSSAMRRHFEERGEFEMAGRFRPSSMEYARSLGDDPLTVVTEMPLFLINSLPDGPVERADLDSVRSRLQAEAARGGASFEQATRELEINAMPLRDQMRLQLLFLDEALQCVRARAMEQRQPAGTSPS